MTTQTATPEIEIDDFDDLNELLSIALEVAAARKAVKTRGAAVDPALAQIAEAAEAALRWKPEAAIARFAEVHCACGSSHKRFDGWFIFSTHRTDPGARRFLRADNHNDLPAWQYTALEEVTYCTECVSTEDLPIATPDYLMGIDALGQAATTATEQLSFDLQEIEE